MLVAALVVQAQALVQVLAQAPVRAQPVQVLLVAWVLPVQWVLLLAWLPLLPLQTTTITPQCLFLSQTKPQHTKTPPDGGVFFCPSSRPGYQAF